MPGKATSKGVTLPELLVVVAIIALAVLAAVPSISDTVRNARMRSAARQIEVTMRAARILAVTQQQDVGVEVRPAPALPATPGPTENQVEYTDLNGRLRVSTMPTGIRIVASTSPIVFRPNGTLSAEALTTLEVTTHDGVRSWEVRTSALGVTRVSE